MPNRSKQKGDRYERKVVEWLRSIGCVDPERIPLSGAAGGSFTGDVQFEVASKTGDATSFRGEVKVRAGCRGYNNIVSWIGGNDVLFLCIPYEEPLVVLTPEAFSRLVYLAQGEDIFDGGGS